MKNNTGYSTIEEFRIPESEHGKRMDSTLSLLIPSLTRVQIKRLFNDKRVTINGKYNKPSKSVRGGELVKVEIPPPVSLDIEPENIDIEYLYEDKDIIVINKPAGISVHPGAGIYSGTLVNALLFKTKDLSGIGGKIRPGIVHRLDKDTTGIMLIAKNDLAHLGLSEQFKSKTIQKRYLALIHGDTKQDTGIISLPLGRHITNRKKISSKTNKPRSSVTNWRLIKRYSNISYVEAEPLTGRTHQIRVHFSEIGHPLIGDKIYGKTKYSNELTACISRLLNRQALHAYSLSFDHPRSSRRITLEAPIPNDFAQALAILDNNGQVKP